MEMMFIVMIGATGLALVAHFYSWLAGRKGS